MNGTATPLNRLMERLAAELGTLEAAGERVEAMVGDLVERVKEPAPRELQELDLLVQSVRDLAAFAAALSRTTPGIDLDLDPGLAALKLQRLREGLAGAAPNGTGEAEEDILF